VGDIQWVAQIIQISQMIQKKKTTVAVAEEQILAINARVWKIQRSRNSLNQVESYFGPFALSIPQLCRYLRNLTGHYTDFSAASSTSLSNPQIFTLMTILQSTLL
jgi:hypothetical protein